MAGADSPDDLKPEQDEEWTNADEDEVREDESRTLDSARTDLQERDIEQVYQAGKTRLVTQMNDFLLKDLRVTLRGGTFANLEPDYQRRKCWSDEKRSRLIESLLMNVPIPPVFLYENALAEYEVMDGQQRLETLRAFLDNEFKLKGLKEWACLNGRSMDRLPPAIQNGLLRRTLTAVIVLYESASDDTAAWMLRQSVFERLNTGMEKLNAQEIRNCIYHSQFSKLLIELARSDQFTTIWGIPPRESGEPKTISSRLQSNHYYARMIDSEIVLRFFALSCEDDIRGSMKTTLDNCLKAHMKDSDKDIGGLRDQYTQALTLAQEIYGDDVFRLPGDTRKKRPPSRPLCDAVMVGLHRVLAKVAPEERAERAASLLGARVQILAGTNDLLTDEKTYPLLVGRLNTRDATIQRLRLMTCLFCSAVSRT